MSPIDEKEQNFKENRDEKLIRPCPFVKYEIFLSITIKRSFPPQKYRGRML
jgi:hypothetical protein